jgi:hypothetical protein
MRTATRVLGVLGALAVTASFANAQVNSNDSPRNNGGDVVFIYSSPSSGFSVGTNPPDLNGDLYWRAMDGGMMNDFDALIGSSMEVDGMYESLFDTHWGTASSPASSAPDFYDRTFGPANADSGGLGGLEPSFFTLGVTAEVLVSLGNSGFGNPCTVAPSLCSPSGGTCPPAGFVNGYLIDIGFGSTPGTGIVMPADGVAGSALTYFVTGGMTASGGVCGLGDYGLQDIHSTDESAGDTTGNLINVNGGFQVAASGPIMDAISSMCESHETWRGNICNMQADSGVGLGVEIGDNGGGGTNGRRLSVGSGLATLGVEIRDLGAALSGCSILGVAGASLTGLPNPGIPALGGNLLVLPDGVFNSTAGVWQGPIAAGAFVFTTEGSFTGAQVAIPATAAGVTLFVQGLNLNVCSGGLGADTTNATTVTLTP